MRAVAVILLVPVLLGAGAPRSGGDKDSTPGNSNERILKVALND